MAVFNIYYYIYLQSIVLYTYITFTIVILYIFMSACLHLKTDADIQKQRVQTNADIKEWLKIRVFICNVCMSA